jgi:misacylated tRNA(Ala) deacylase
MTEKIYLTDAYARKTEAKVIAKEGKNIEFEKTVFYPTGGGVPCDIGTVTSTGKIYNVVETKKEGDLVIHVFESEPDLKVGDSCTLEVNWEKRYAHMRYHTAVHVISGIAEGKYGAIFTGNQIYYNKARFDLSLDKLDKEFAQKILNESQEIVDQNKKILVKFLSKEEALAIPNLARTVPGQELLKKLDVIRVVEIDNFDVQLDGGPHVANTSEIGKIELSGWENKGSARKRIEIILK